MKRPCSGRKHMKGLMMHRPLKIADLITFAADTYPAG